jgi:hypothetical protein
MESASGKLTRSLKKALIPFIRFGTEYNHNVYESLLHTLNKYERSCDVFGGTTARKRTDTIHCVFSPQYLETLVYMRKRVNFVIKDLTDGLEWAQNLIEDTLLPAIEDAEPGVLLENLPLYQTAIDHAFHNGLRIMTEILTSLDRHVAYFRLYRHGVLIQPDVPLPEPPPERRRSPPRSPSPRPHHVPDSPTTTYS